MRSLPRARRGLEICRREMRTRFAIQDVCFRPRAVLLLKRSLTLKRLEIAIELGRKKELRNCQVMMEKIPRSIGVFFPDIGENITKDKRYTSRGYHMCNEMLIGDKQARYLRRYLRTRTGMNNCRGDVRHLVYRANETLRKAGSRGCAIDIANEVARLRQGETCIHVRASPEGASRADSVIRTY